MAEQTETDKMGETILPEAEDDAVATDQALLARRRLLRLGAYVPPAILGMAILGSMPSAAQAHSTVGSCSPTACQPCINLSRGSNRLQDRVQCRNAQSSRSTKSGGS